MGNADDPVGPHRARLRALAYRMLGSASDADDVLQEAWLRLTRTPGIADEGAWLTTVVTRLSLDKLRADRNRREEYVGPWLPEPVATLPDEVDPETVSFAFLCLLERLSPTERAVFLLHSVFERSHVEIAEILSLSHAAVRQLHHRAKGHIAAEQPRFAPSREAHAAILAQFGAACMSTNPDMLRALFSADARVHTDGGGKARAALHVVEGADACTRFILGLVHKGRLNDLEIVVADVNGWPAITATSAGTSERTDRGDCVIAIETDGDKICAVFVVVNPDKLHALQRPS